MKKTFLMVGAATMAVMAAACSGGSSSGGTGLTSGSYTISNAAANPDTCLFGDLSSLNGTAHAVTVAGNNVSVDLGGSSPLALTLAGTALSAPQTTFDINWTDSSATGLAHSYNCMEHDTTDYTGTVTGKNKFNINVDNNWTAASGDPTACRAGNNSAYMLTLTQFPCESKIHVDLAK